MDHISTFKQLVEQDIWGWIKNYIEVNHKFYNYKFPPCPYAKAARLAGLLDVSAYTDGSTIDFIQNQVNELITNKKFNTRVLIFPPHYKWNYYLHWRVRQLNIKILKQDFYLQYGQAVKTSSQYPGICKNKPYFIVIVNKLSDVLDAHESLLKTNYYSSWSKKHYHNVVIRRQQMVKKIKGNNNELD